jgi:hypothetical protein
VSSPADQKARLLDAVRRVPSPARAAVDRSSRTRFAGAVVVAALVFVAIGGMRVGSRPAPLIVASGAVWGIIAVGATALALWRGRSMLGAPRAWLLGGAAAVVPLLAMSWVCLPFPAVVESAPHAFGHDAVCFVLTLALAAAPLFVLVRGRVEGDPVRPAWTGAALGAAAGAWGAALIDLHCDRIDLVHVLLGHVAPVLVLTAVGALWARSALAVR